MAELEKILCTDSRVEAVKKINAIIENGGNADINDKITNCLLEVPQNIKLELNNGVLTLKAGSKVYDGNGLFAEITNDISNPTPAVNSQVVVMVANGGLYTAFMGDSVSTLPTNASTYKIFYNTTDKKCYFDAPSGWVQCSFPIALATGTTTNWTSIDQVFNGMGYIGSTAFVLPNVKGLIPNGINEDGTLNNIEYTTTKVATVDCVDNYNQALNLYANGNLNIYGLEGIFRQSTAPKRTDGGQNMLWYNPETNYWKYTQNNGSTWHKVALCDIGGVIATDKITSLTTKPIFRVADYNEVKEELSTKLNTSQISNCITEIPQKIKLELNNGTLTLKAGSIVTIPNGFEADGSPKFDYVTVEKDVTCTGWGNYTGVVVVKNGGVAFTTLTQTSSGASATIAGGNVWYDTTTNTVKRCDDASTWTSGYSLPVCVAISNGTSSGGVAGIASIQQVFNGMGYIGSTVWVDKGVKGLIPNGRNEDGSLNNVEYTQKNIKFEHLQNNQSFIIGVGTGVTQSNYYAEQEAEPATNYTLWYRPSENKMYRKSGAGVVSENNVFVGYEVTTGASGITSLQPKQPFRAVDYSEYVSTPHIVDTYKNGTSWYRIWSDGWKEQGGLAANVQGEVSITFLKSFSDTNYYINCNSPLEATYSFQTCGISSRTTTGFKVMQKSYNNDGGACDTCWYTCGY